MERQQTQTPGTPDHAELANQDEIRREPRYGHGAASALAFLKRLERDRANAAPADDRTLN
jgi:hypothetical protein